MTLAVRLIDVSDDANIDPNGTEMNSQSAFVIVRTTMPAASGTINDQVLLEQAD